MPFVLAERLADRVDAIVGVDTHTDTHTAAVVSPLGSVLAELTVAATADGGVSASQVTRLPERILHETWREQLFYVPELKYYAKFVIERYNADEVRYQRETELLSAYSVHP